MKKLKTRYKVLMSFGILALIVVILSILWTQPKYEYIPGEYTGKLVINGTVYEEIREYKYKEIYQALKEQGITPFEDETAIGIMDYIFVDDVWKYEIYGSKSVENRILLRGEEDFFLNDVNYPEVYFCRQDILEHYKETE